MVVALPSVFLALAVTSAPRAVTLRPSEALSLDPNLFLATESSPPKNESHFSSGWLIAGIAGGAATGALVGTAIGTTWCRELPGEPGKGAAVGGIYLTLGSLFGLAAATDHHWGKTASILIDTVGPLLGGIALLTAPIACAH